jgi:hypothetical protein
MANDKLTDAEASSLWREAERRLRLVDIEPPLSTAQVDGLLQVLGPRSEGESLEAWLKRGRSAEAAARPQQSAQIIPFSPRRQRFVPVAEIVRLAADTAGPEVMLPATDLESADGRFRLRVRAEGNEVVIELQALGLASDDYAGRRVGIAGAQAGAALPVAVIELDADGDGQVRLPDTPALRLALLRPVIGLIEDR